MATVIVNCKYKVFTALFWKPHLSRQEMFQAVGVISSSKTYDFYLSIFKDNITIQ